MASKKKIKKKGLSLTDVVTVAVAWAGATAIALLVMENLLVVIICIASAYYLAKWIILKKDDELSVGDVLGIALCWGGATTITYFIRDPLIAIICIAAAYYLAKWIIFREERD